MNVIKYENEGMDLKKLLLLLIKKLWIVVLAAVLGAVAGGGIYLLHHVALSSNREYQAQSKVYLDFAYDETGEVYQQYNGYTWNDLMSTDLILNNTMSYLPEDYTPEEVVNATSAEILSDIRLLTITITTSSAERTAMILEATDKSLVDMGQREKEFIDIEVIKTTVPKLLTASPRLMQAVLVGGAIALILVLIALAFIYILDDRIYVAGDLKCVTRLPFVGYSFMGTDKLSKREQELADRLQKDMERNMAYLENKLEEITEDKQTKTEDKQTKTEDKQTKTEDKQTKTEDKQTKTEDKQIITGDVQTKPDEKPESLITIELEKSRNINEQMLEKARRAKGIILAVPYGKSDRTSFTYIVEQLKLQDCEPIGIIIKDSDIGFMKWYYNHL